MPYENHFGQDMMPERGHRSVVLQCKELQKIIYLTLEKEFRPLQRYVKDFADGDILRDCLRKAEEKMHEKFAEQMHLIQHASEREVEALIHEYPKTEQYLSFVGVDEDVIQGMTKIRGICLMQLLSMSDKEIVTVLKNFCAPADNGDRLLYALNMLRKEIDKLNYPEDYLLNSSPSPSGYSTSRSYLTGCGSSTPIVPDGQSSSLEVASGAPSDSGGGPSLANDECSSSLAGPASDAGNGHASDAGDAATLCLRLPVSALESASHSRSQTPHATESALAGRASPPGLVDSMAGREEAVGFVSEAATASGSYDLPPGAGPRASPRPHVHSVAEAGEHAAAAAASASNSHPPSGDDELQEVVESEKNYFIARAFFSPSRSVPSTPGPVTKQPRSSTSPPSSPLIRTHRGIFASSSSAVIGANSVSSVSGVAGGPPGMVNGGVGPKPGTPPPNHRRIQVCVGDGYGMAAPLYKSLSHESDLHNRVGTGSPSNAPTVAAVAAMVAAAEAGAGQNYARASTRSSGGQKQKKSSSGHVEFPEMGNADTLLGSVWSPGGPCHNQYIRRHSVDERINSGSSQVASGCTNNNHNSSSELVASADATCGVGINNSCDVSLSVPLWSPKSSLNTCKQLHSMKTKTTVLPWPMATQKCALCQKPIRGKLKQCRYCKNSWHPDCASRAPSMCTVSGSRSPLGSAGGLNSTTGITQDQLSQYVMRQDNAVDTKGSPSVGRKTSHQQPLSVPHCMLRPAQSTPTFNGSDSNSNSSCSSTPSSPFVDQQSPAAHRAGRSTTKPSDSSGGGSHGGNGSGQIFDFPSQPEIRIDEVETPAHVGTNSSNESDKTVIDEVQLRHFGVRETNINRADSVDDGQDEQGGDKGNLQRNNSRVLSTISVTLKEWDIPFQELKLEEQVGRGQFSTVHRGQWHGEVAIKILDMNPDEDNRERLSAFKLEVATLRKTRHDNLVLFMGACMKPPHPLAIVTSFCKGETLHQQLHHRRHRFGVNKSITIALQICQGMSYLHARDIVHKDLKSKNIFVDSVGKVVISDFGLFNATRMCRATTARGDAISVPVGWLGYLAPEIIRRLSVSVSDDGCANQQAGQKAGSGGNTGSNSSSGSTGGEEQQLPFSRHSDVFAFGTVWYEMLTVEWPFRTHPPEAIIYLVGNGIKPPLPSVQGPKDIKEILLRCWSYEPKERSSFVELKAQLEKLPKLHRNPSYPVKSGSMSRSHESLV